MAADQVYNSIFQCSERLLRNDDWLNNSQLIADVWLNMYGMIYWLTSNFLIVPNTWFFNKSVHHWAREWYWHRNDHIFVFLSKLTMLYLRSKVSAMFSCQSGKWYVRPKETLVIPYIVCILNCLTFTLKIYNDLALKRRYFLYSGNLFYKNKILFCFTTLYICGF